MKLGNNTLLITGGATGIGLALTERFLQADSQVIVCGRRAEALEEAQRQLPGLHIRVCDVARPEEREELARWVQQEFPALNVLINNAGIEQRLQLAAPDASTNWADYQNELAINVDAPMHLALLLIPHLRRQQHSAIYSATKAAMHSFTLSLRHQLAATPSKVLEIVPPAVNTDLGGPGLHTFGVPVDAFADSVLERLDQGEQEVGYGTSEQARLASREQLDARFRLMNQ